MCDAQGKTWPMVNAHYIPVVGFTGFYKEIEECEDDSPRHLFLPSSFLVQRRALDLG